MENEILKLKNVISEYEEIIEETHMQINVAKQRYSKDIDEMLDITESLEHKINMLETSKLKPYFARIDFKDKNEKLDECYIGKVGVSNNDNEIITVDWRAPISSLYYDSNLGECSYDSPDGKIDGELLLKRQYDIENGILNGYNDVDIVSQDEILKNYLDVNADTRLKNIVASIQGEQNKIIREKLEKNIVIQGCAGSGKTTVALHRIAYLVYNNRNKIKNKDYLIIGPNKFFVNYISSILPDLDVNGVKQYSFIELAKDFINEEFEVIDTPDNESTFYKTSFNYKKVIDKYIDDLLNQVIPDKDLILYDFTIINRNEILKIYNDITEYTCIKNKVEKTISLIEKEVERKRESLILKSNNYIDKLFNNETNEKIKKELVKKRIDLKNEIENSCHNILKTYFKIVNDKVINVYKNLLTNIDKYEQNETILNYFKRDLSLINKKKIEYEDLAALMYLKYKIDGSNNYNNYKQVVIDEAQDYNEFVFYTLRVIFKNAFFSIFGDLAQSIYPYRSIEDWNLINDKVMNIEIEYLEKSYRTSIEIMNEANKINRYLGYREAIPVIRHGEVPKYINDTSNDNLLKLINSLKDEGYKTIAVISKNDKESNEIYEYLKDKIEINNINSNSSEYKGGICTITSTLCKGLEFDAVIISNVSSFDFDNRNDMKLLYVSMTRALHKMYLLYDGKLNEILT